MPQFTDDFGIEITYYEWLVPSPKANVVILHGIGEHALRYTEVAKRLNQAGYSVIADDHRGHGQTGYQQWNHDLSALGRPGPGGLRALEDAIERITVRLRQEHPGVPLVLLGHSLGSLIAQRMLNENPFAFDAVVLSASAYRMPGSMESGDLNKHHKHLGTTGFEWLSRDPEVAAAFVADPLCFRGDVLKMFGLRDGLRLFGLPSTQLPPSLPLYIVSGTEDPLSVGTSIGKLAQSYRNRAGLEDVTLKLYEGARHEVFNETNKDEVLDDLVAWLDQHFAGSL
jgi:alpha-beta hydrolase superfamily lysophospholipase